MLMYDVMIFSSSSARRVVVGVFRVVVVNMFLFGDIVVLYVCLFVCVCVMLMFLLLCL